MIGLSIVDQLACAFDRHDEQPNIELAQKLAATQNPDKIIELLDLLTKGTKPQRHDAIKVAYELAERAPKSLDAHLDIFFTLLATKDNRMLWGTLCVLDALADTFPTSMMTHLNKLLDATDRSSVIGKDKTMSLLAKLNAHSQFNALITPVIFDRLRHAATNQTPQYAEASAPTITKQNWPKFAEIVQQRHDEISYPAKKKRLNLVLNSRNSTS